MKNVQKGFTLIELMIVVAIIAILAAIAIPVYSDYVAKSQATAALAEITGGKTTFELALTEGKSPATPVAIGLSNETSRCKTITVDSGTAGDGASIECTMSGATGKIMDETITITRTEETEQDSSDPDNIVDATAAQWNCSSSAKQKYLPSSCEGK